MRPTNKISDPTWQDIYDRDVEIALLQEKLSEQTRLTEMTSEREARLKAQLEEARNEFHGIMKSLPVTTVAFTGDYGLYVRNCVEYLLRHEGGKS